MEEKKQNRTLGRGALIGKFKDAEPDYLFVEQLSQYSFSGYVNNNKTNKQRRAVK